ncbi:MAG: RNA polymerase factor sigma-54 [Bacteroidia bacterium]|nr:RNA polymerase factor sigma-54 [Bacteroidia bacterium]MCO5253444.1 RNA polymerase factor sigma-54 [Bacteroidota bacterium]MCZ2129897.1 RNA polymerase factor sigma-54 [Bacteroidia bacterium]
MLKQTLSQKLQQKMSPQQIQFMKLLQLGTADFMERVEQELLDNPALEKSNDGDTGDDYEKNDDFDNDNIDSTEDTFDDDISDYLSDSNDDGGFRLNEDYGDEEKKEFPIPTFQTFYEYLIEQADTNIYDEKQLELAHHLIGSLEDDGYLRRDLKAIVNDLMFTANISTTVEELEKVLHEIQQFDPAGVAARDLKECLLLQLNRKLYEAENKKDIQLAITILNEHLEVFTKKHFDKLSKSLKVSDVQLKNAITEITKLNPKPGQISNSTYREQYVNPDFTVEDDNGELRVLLNSKNAPELRLSRNYQDTLRAYSANTDNKQLKESAQYVKQKIDGAKWFIDSIKQRQNTLLSTMRAIVSKQRDFFYEGNETLLKPMVMKDIADEIGMDISTVSRVANSKYVETSFGIFPLKFFFSEGLSTDGGDEVSNREIKTILKEEIGKEDKSKPLTDEELMDILNKRGYNIARRTIAKYREQLNIPVSRMRKQL